jgi:beta-lysine 5,6-aminomutase alpha subunit
MAEVKEKIRLDKSLIDKARNSAKRVAENTQSFIDLHTTIAVEARGMQTIGNRWRERI